MGKQRKGEMKQKKGRKRKRRTCGDHSTVVSPPLNFGYASRLLVM